MCQRPVDAFREFQHRLSRDGLTASFPEFAPAVNALIDRVEQSTTDSDWKRSTLVHLRSVGLKFEIEDNDTYPHSVPYKGTYPYLPTIHAIICGLQYIDSEERAKGGCSALYHTARYAHHLHHIYDSEFVYFPTTDEVTMHDLIVLRGVPIGILGVTTTTVFADAYWNSPLDFFYHDVNHVRRMATYTKKSMTDVELHRRSRFCKSLVVSSGAFRNDLSRMIQCIAFELLHEYAYEPCKESFITAFRHKPGDPSPFEYMADDTWSHTDVEHRRLTNGNLRSGLTDISRATRVIYFMDSGPNVLSSAFNKLTNGFYCHRLSDSDELPRVKTKEMFAEAVRMLCLRFSCQCPPNLDLLLSLPEPIEKYPQG